MVSFDKMIKWLHTIIQKRFHLTVKAQDNRNNNENVTGTPDTNVMGLFVKRAILIKMSVT